MAHGARDRYVLELARGEHATKHESAAAHVTASDEVGRKTEAAVKPALDHVDILSGGDAPEQDHGVVTGERGGERGGVALKGLAEFRLAGGHADLRDLAEVLEADDRVGRNEPAAWRDYQYSVGDRPRAREGAPVRELASEVETAQEGEDLAQRRPALAELNGERERGFLPKKDLGPPPAAVRRREEEDGLGGRVAQPLRVGRRAAGLDFRFGFGGSPLSPTHSSSRVAFHVLIIRFAGIPASRACARASSV